MTDLEARMTGKVLIGLGANLGDARAALVLALTRLSGLPGVRLLRASSLYRSHPVDADGPDFLNAVALLEAEVAPLRLLDQLQAIEVEAGRQRPYRNAPRTLDLDLLSFGDLILHDERLTLPHPRLQARRFVIEPLLEIWPDCELPGLGPVAALAAAVAAQEVHRMDSAPPWQA